MKLLGKGFRRLLEISLQDIINSYIVRQTNDVQSICNDSPLTFDVLIIFEIVKDSFYFDYYELEVGYSCCCLPLRTFCLFSHSTEPNFLPTPKKLFCFQSQTSYLTKKSERISVFLTRQVSVHLRFLLNA
jgi:hypothetical protein